MAEILIEGVRYSFDPETEYMKVSSTPFVGSLSEIEFGVKGTVA